MTEIYQIIEDLRNTNSRKDKEEILRAHRQNGLLKKCFALAYDPTIRFWVTGDSIPESLSEEAPLSSFFTGNANPLSEFLFFLENDISTRKYTGNEAIEKILGKFDLMRKEDVAIARNIISKDLRCGVSAKTINKIWPGLVFQQEVMLPTKESPDLLEKISMPAYCQKKMDGTRISIIVTSSKSRLGIDVVVLTRNGTPMDISNTGLEKDIENLYHIYRTISRPLPLSNVTIFDGEALILDNDSSRPLDRKTGNGIINKILKGTASNYQKNQLAVCLWDVYDGDYSSNLNYHARLQYLSSAVHELDSNRIRLIETEIVDNSKEAKEIAAEWISEGLEGAVLKDPNGKFEPKRVKHQVKIKAIRHADLIVTAWVNGTGKYESMLGAVQCQTDDGQLVTWVGSGFSDKERYRFSQESDNIVGKIITVEYNEIIKSSVSDAPYSLYLPRFIEVREDKMYPNSFEEIE